MSVSSILFRGQSESSDTDVNQSVANQSAPPARSLRRRLKPWPFHSAAASTEVAADESSREIAEPTPAAVLDRLSQFVARR